MKQLQNFALVFGGVIFVVLMGSLFWTNYKLKLVEKATAPEESLQEEEAAGSLLEISVEKSLDNKSIEIVLTPNNSDGGVAVSAFEIVLGIWRDSRQELRAENQLLLNSPMVTAGWEFPFAQAETMDNNKLMIKLSGYLPKKEGQVINHKTVVASVPLQNSFEDKLVIYEVTNRNTHFFRTDLSSTIPFTVK
jgi:hypothetical protein